MWSYVYGLHTCKDTKATKTPISTCTWTHRSNTPDTYVAHESFINSQFEYFCFGYEAAVQRAEESRRAGKKSHCLLLLKNASEDLLRHVSGASQWWGPPFPLCPPHPWEHCVGPLTCSPSLLCHPAESVTTGSKSKLNLILIHLIEEPDPKVEAVFDLLEGMERKDYGCLSYLGTIKSEREGLFPPSFPPFLLIPNFSPPVDLPPTPFFSFWGGGGRRYEQLSLCQHNQADWILWKKHETLKHTI